MREIKDEAQAWCSLKPHNTKCSSRALKHQSKEDSSGQMVTHSSAEVALRQLLGSSEHVGDNA